MVLKPTDLRAVIDGNETEDPAATEAAEEGQPHVVVRLHSKAVMYIGRWLGAHHLEMQGGEGSE